MYHICIYIFTKTLLRYPLSTWFYILQYFVHKCSINHINLHLTMNNINIQLYYAWIYNVFMVTCKIFRANFNHGKMLSVCISEIIVLFYCVKLTWLNIFKCFLLIIWKSLLYFYTCNKPPLVPVCRWKWYSS